MSNDRSLAVVVTANLTQMRAELAKADAVIATTSSAMKRMGESYSGASTISQANAAMLAVKDLGGVSKLTEAEQRKLNSTVTEAIAKYQALGQQAPADMLKLRDATKQADDTTNSLTSRMKGLAAAMGLAFSAAAVVQGIKTLITNTFEYAETIKDAAAKMDVSLDATQRWKFAAEQTGASLENVSKSVLKLSQGIDGNDKSLQAALKQAGVQFESLKGMKPEDAFTVVAEAIAKIPDPMTQSRVALEAFGKSGQELLPAIREGFVDIGRQATVMSDATINALDRAKDKWQEFSNKVTVATGGIVAKILGMMEKIAPAMQLMFAVTGQRDAADMWSVFAKGADTANASVQALTASQKKYVDELIRAKGLDVVTEFAKGDAAMTAYVNSLKAIPPAATGAGTSLSRAAVEANKFKMSLPGVTDAVSAKAFFDSIRIGGNEFVMSLPGVTAKVDDFITSIRVGTDEIENYMMRLPGVADESASGFMASLEARNDDLRSVGARWGDALASSFAKSLQGLGNIIIGAIQGGGSVGASALAYIGNSMGSDLGKKIAEGIGGTLGKTLGGFIGPLGSMLGGLVGGAIDKIFGKNQGREDAKGFAAAYGGFDALREKMLALGAEGDRLWIALTQNTKGPAQVAATIRQIEDAFRKQEEASKSAASAAEAGAAREIDATNKAKAAIQSKIDTLDSERESVFGSIREELENPEYDAAGNRIYGVIEAQGLARLEEIDKQKAALQVQMEEAASKVTDQAVIVRKGIEEIFKDPIKVMFDYLTNLPVGGFPPSGAPPLPAPIPGSAGFSRPSFGGVAAAAQTFIGNVILNVDGQELARNQMKFLPGKLALAGR